MANTHYASAYIRSEYITYITLDCFAMLCYTVLCYAMQGRRAYLLAAVEAVEGLATVLVRQTAHHLLRTVHTHALHLWIIVRMNSEERSAKGCAHISCLHLIHSFPHSLTWLRSVLSVLVTDFTDGTGVEKQSIITSARNTRSPLLFLAHMSCDI